MLLGQTLLSRYKVIQELGSGGFGDTYLAQDIALPGHPLCVVKHLKPKNLGANVLPIAKGLFEREAEFLYRLGEFDQIPRLYAHFEEGGEFYLVQEFVEGNDLGQELIPGQPLGEAKTIQLLQEILEVLVVVHQHNVIHRDIKPQNIMRRSRDRKLILIDFGAVKEVSALTVNTQGQTSVTVSIGSPGYMPSEQASGRPKLASDVYAVGMLGIQALTGLPPFHLPEDPQTGEILWRDRVVVSDGFAQVLSTMIRDHFSQRYQNASEALQALVATQLPLTVPPALVIPTTVVSPHRVNSASPVPAQPISKPQSKKFLLLGAGLAIAGGVALASIARFSSPSPSPVVSSPTPTPVSSPSPSPVASSPAPTPDLPPEEIEIEPPQKQVSIPSRPTPAVTPATDPQPPRDRVTPAVLEPPPINNSPSAVWRSNSGKTVIPGLDSICWGNRLLSSAQTVFNGPAYVGNLAFDSPISGGCEPGDTLSGEFNLSSGSNFCRGAITVSWRPNNNASIKWAIDNVNAGCPVNTRNWEINTYPVTQ